VRIAVLGVGLIGGSIGLAARAQGAHVVGYGRSSERLETARARGAIDTAARSVEEALDGAGVCFCCGPVGALPQQVQAALDAAGTACAVSDVGSTKAHVVASVDDERFVGGHPVAGAETSGVQNARPDLFEGAAWYLTPSERSSGVLKTSLMVPLVAGRVDPSAYCRG
jgi:prephenate dehydrogenase